MITKLFRFTNYLLLLVFFSSFNTDHELLKKDDVNKIMTQIFEQHGDKDGISDKIIQNSLKVYIDQFDPERIYLLEEEVAPFLNPSPADLKHIAEEYKNSNFQEYKNINLLIEKAIIRARLSREKIEQDPAEIYQASEKIIDRNDNWNDPDLKAPFPKTIEELNARLKHRFIVFMAAERRRFGDAPVYRNQGQVLKLYEKQVRNQETPYLSTNSQGIAITDADLDNMFYMHILKALASSLDAHTTFYNPTEAYDMKVRLEKEVRGVGIVVQPASDGSLIVSQMIEGGPAEKSGLIQLHDRIIELDGQKVADIPFDEILSKLHGKEGTPVNLVLKRQGTDDGQNSDQLINVNLTSASTSLSEGRVDTNYEKFGNGILGVITLHSFYQGEGDVSSEKDMRDAIQKLDAKGNLRGLILDLRDNSGGFLTQAVKVVGLFINDGVVVISKYFNGEEHFYRDVESKVSYKGPLIILTSKATASAAEIVAQALQDYGIAVVVGDDRTFGKGTIQSQTVTGGGASSYFKVTVGKYYTVSGKTPQINGVKSDIIVPSPLNRERIGEEYLEHPVPADSIDPSYKDPLIGIDPSLKSWYMRYYMPNLQSKETLWKEMVPTLKKNSEYRLSNNGSYKGLLNRLKAGSEQQNNENADDSNDDDNQDIQMKEAVNILKDMVLLHSHARDTNEDQISEKPQELLNLDRNK